MKKIIFYVLLITVPFVITILFLALAQIYSPAKASFAYPPPEANNAYQDIESYPIVNSTLNGMVGYPPPQAELMSTSSYPAQNETVINLTPAPSAKYIGPDCLVDPITKISMQLPDGWYGVIGAGNINITNYDFDKIVYRHGQPQNIPENNIKIEIYELNLSSNQTLDQWAQNEKYKPGIQEDNNRAVSENYAIKLGNLEGVVYAQTDSLGWNSRIFIFNVDPETNFVAHIFPADSNAFSYALSVLASINVNENLTCSYEVNSGQENLTLPEELDQIPIFSPSSFECPTGTTYPGTEAYTSTIDLQMPFPWGQTWIVGGEGAYYGNYHHCNYYNNYYATDWNRPDNVDYNYPVVSVAEGIVSSVDFPPCTTERYGCYVDIDHNSGFRTRYAHLENVFVEPGDSVMAGSLLGTVGSSGTTNYHLHLSFWHLDPAYYPPYDYGYYSLCGNNGYTCPNGDSPLFPQGYKPSPMWTSYGNTFLTDGLLVTSVNGQPLFLPIIIK